MTPKTNKAAVASLKKGLAGRRMIAFVHDHQLQDLLAIWELVACYQVTPDPTPEAFSSWPELGQDVWAAWCGWAVNLTTVTDALGATFPAGEVVRRATALGLAYPNGELHPTINAWLDTEARRLVALAKGDKKSTTVSAGK